MFLALKELRHEKLRYGLVIAMIALISYMIFILTGLASGLANQNTAAIDSWQIKKIVLNKDADTNLRQSLLTNQEVAKGTQNHQVSVIGQATIVAKRPHHANISGTFIGINPNQALASQIKITTGHQLRGKYQLVVDDSLADKGLKIGDQLTFNSDPQKYTIVGFTHNAKMSVTPVIYGNIAAWANIRQLPATFGGSALVSSHKNLPAPSANSKTYPVADFIAKLPGYAAQNSTFIFMIGFLLVISLIIIAVFLYIITMQKLPNYAVLRAQGIPARLLVTATLLQAGLLTVIGLVIGTLLTYGTDLALPAGVPVSFDLPLLGLGALGLLLMAFLGALIPGRVIAKVDPITVIGG
ncbi:ABC transporter permease [Ligilactobacillus saerimneri]|uniref:ABC transporter permease n=1 Tax=Ligilactobacillus saerimneri TaxID=228229 RepID=UPI001C101676|nr:ABC transporter permease [Ligilactobacillus saerimneri]MBU5310259.1 ABC transporter permease [Ligilactobacillus saerimneri]MCZ0891317.1 ABC transporter permease [Ligilactobacillus saerimneri]MDI9206573.1 ABC transporter permease [Ligilactobacillus saerimneri]